MSQIDVDAVLRPNRRPGSKEGDPETSVAARLRSHKQLKETAVTAVRDTETAKGPADEAEASGPTPGRMSRQQTATGTPTEEPLARRESGSSSQSATPVEALSQICLCQPDPKIPRPRNGMS